MKKVLLLVAIAGGIYAHTLYSANPWDIEEPTYVEARITLDFPHLARELEYVLMGEMVSTQDCSARSERFVINLFEKCPECEIKRLQCRDDIANRYKKLFYGHTTHTTYLSLEKGSRFERNGRMLVWGLDAREADEACRIMKEKIKEKYEGSVNCVAGRVL